MPADLELISNDDLIAELTKRFDAIVFLTELDKSESRQSWWRYYKGNFSRTLGMIERAKARLIAEDAESNA